MSISNYEDIPFLPSLIAESVLMTKYTGIEFSQQVRSQNFVDKIELLREKIGDEAREEFVEAVDKMCKSAFSSKAKWFMDCVEAKGNLGLEQMYIWVNHWLASYISNKRAFMKLAESRG